MLAKSPNQKIKKLQIEIDDLKNQLEIKNFCHAQEHSKWFQEKKELLYIIARLSKALEELAYNNAKS